ncbi:MAG TPA: ABC transporter ATP-binding protein [Pseudogracilibacillus sp.]|nr:ABC transporter ATP-binding protein [Pseudogracilibacillus sp.]
MIRFENVSKEYGDVIAIKQADLEVKEGEFLVLIGPSGCGKTTMLKMVNRLIPLTTGTIYINDKRISDYNINELRWNIGYVLQQIALFPHLTIAENIAIVPELKKWKRTDIDKRIKELMELVGIDYEVYKNRLPEELSGGQQQRIGVIRALAADPDILLMDEPFSALDPLSRGKLQDELISIQQQIKKTIVFVTHDMQEALKLADRVCILKAGEVVQVGTPQEIVNNPENEFVKSFIKGEVFDFKKLIKPIQDFELIGSVQETDSLQTILNALADYEAISVMNETGIIGMLERDEVYKEISHELESVGE